MNQDETKKTDDAAGELKLWTNGTETYVARDADHVLELYRQTTGEAYDAEDMGEWSEREDKGPFQIKLDDGRGAVTQSHADWIKENGPGVLCSTEW